MNWGNEASPQVRCGKNISRTFSPGSRRVGITAGRAAQAIARQRPARHPAAREGVPPARSSRAAGRRAHAQPMRRTPGTSTPTPRPAARAQPHARAARATEPRAQPGRAAPAPSRRQWGLGGGMRESHARGDPHPPYSPPFPRAARSGAPRRRPRAPPRAHAA